MRVRLPALERALGCRLGDLAEADLVRLASERVEEGDQLDFKSTFAASAADREELAKDVCAFADELLNHHSEGDAGPEDLARG